MLYPYRSAYCLRTRKEGWLHSIYVAEVLVAIEKKTGAQLMKSQLKHVAITILIERSHATCTAQVCIPVKRRD